GNLVEVGNRLVVGVIGNNQRNVAGQFATLVAVEQIDQAVIVLRNENDHALPNRRLCQPPLHIEGFSDRREILAEIRQVFLRKVDVEVPGIELDPHQKQTRLFVGVLISVQDVSIMPVD